MSSFEPGYQQLYAITLPDAPRIRHPEQKQPTASDQEATLSNQLDLEFPPLLASTAGSTARNQGESVCLACPGCMKTHLKCSQANWTKDMEIGASTKRHALPQ